MTRRLRYLSMTTTERLVTEDCIHCGELFGMSETLHNTRLADKLSFYCPKCGKTMAYTGPSELDKLRKEKERLNARFLAQMDQTHAAEREAAEAKASEIRVRWRVGNGVCPCCQRTFPGLASHVATKHPNFLTDDLDRLSTRQVEILAAIRAATEAEDAAVIDTWSLPGDMRSIRALERRNLVVTLGYGRVALTEHGWPLAEKAATRT